MVKMITKEEKQYLINLKDEGTYSIIKKRGKGYTRLETLYRVHFEYMRMKDRLDRPFKVRDFREPDHRYHKRAIYGDCILRRGELQNAFRYGLKHGFIEPVNHNCRGTDYRFTSIVRGG